MADYLTQSKKSDLETEMKHRKSVLRPEIAERVQAARALGDLSENAEYHASRDEQAKNEGRIQEIEHILKHAKIIERSGGSKAELGATVVVKKSGSDDEKTFMLVDHAEADIAKNKISDASPIGAAMMGKSVGDTFSITTPKGAIEYKIISIQ